MKKRTNIFLVASIFLSILIIGCDQIPKTPNEPNKAGLASNTCEGCHTNYELLKTIYSPDTTSGGGGCGGDTPHIEPYDRVYLGGDGYKSFKSSSHGKLECIACHNGVENTSDKKLAHSGNFIKHPSKYAEKKCAGCHTDIVVRAKNSLHEQGWGQKNMVIQRSGNTSFESLPAKLKEGYDKNCAKCHGTCGDCHVNRPKAQGGGLYKGHNFIKTPDMRDQCVGCHTSRGGHAYFGIASGTVPDVHLTKAGYNCMSCHSRDEVHGDGKIYEHRYKMESLPKCTNCHKNLNTSNMYHTIHINTFNCNTCHSQDYNNCGSCHIGGEGARIPSHQSFKIALNPIPDTKPYKFATVRRSLMAPDSWELYGVPSLSNFAVKPTFKYTTPHNILKWTTRTQVASGKTCFDNCHIIKEGTTFRNKNLYLFRSDLINTWEIEPNKNIIVDGKLPIGWGL